MTSQEMTDRDDATEVDCSIVLPVYYNEGSLTPTVESLREKVLAAQPGMSFEIICVDDGSGDSSLDELLALRKRWPQLLRVIKLTRNFGQVNALLAGFSHARGQCVVAMSADGQDPPELINDMLEAHVEEEMEVVIATRKGRDESLYRRATSRAFYSLMRKLTFPEMPKGGFDFVLMGRRALDVFLRNRDYHLFFQGQILWMGFTHKFIEYHRRAREIGTSRWTFGKKLTMLIDGVLAYSFTPIRLISLLGILVSAAGFVYAVVVVAAKLFWGNPTKGWTPLMVVLLLTSGVQMLMLGVIGEYLWRTLAQVRDREPYIVDRIYQD